MKKIAYILISLLPLVSCTEKETPRAKEADVIFVSIGAPATKTQLGTSGKLSWSTGDKVAVFSDKVTDAREFTLRSGAGYSVASFTGEKMEGDMFYAYYPSTARCDGTTFRSTLPTNVKHSVPTEALEGLPLFGSSREISEIGVRNICGVLQFNLTGNGRLKSVILEAEKAISGEFLCILADGTFAMGKSGAHIIKMDASETELSFFKPTPFYFILPPGEYEDIRFTVTDAEGGSTVFAAGETIEIEPGVLTEAKSVAPDVDLIDVSFVTEKNASGCFWYTSVEKNASFCVSYLFGIASREEYEACGMDAEKWLSENGRTCTSSITDMHILSPSTDYVAIAQATSVSGSKDTPVVKPFTTPEIHHDESLAISIVAENILGKSVSYRVTLPAGVEYLSEVGILPATEFDKFTENELIVKCLETRKKGRSLTGEFTDLLPGIDYVMYCVCDNEESISRVAAARFTTLGSKIGGGTEDIDEIEIK